MKIEILDEIKQALANNQPVVSLESTIISHGMPYPQNIEMAQTCENIIRQNNAIPATIAIINGVIKVGLTPEDLHYLATNKEVYKTSSRDLGYVIANKLTGATTVATTSLISEKVGIKVFATGGIGGVHRNAQVTFDISNDLEILAKTSVLVVCAGPKSILDLPLTLEYLETKGVEVLGYQTSKLPAFYCNTSDYDVTYKVNDAHEAANVMYAKWTLENSGIILANPIPQEHSLDATYINKIIQDALLESQEKNITGKQTTPFLLQAITNKTQNKSLQANIALVYNNAAVAAQVACAYANIANQKKC
ncbi:pseudouridine-5'-phosphate glycosidase [Ureaplasma miroungigenitalium]|uniref:Pseudouridine-5'-phosphate glycosidase n=1 Tax=Ureaplasma miroungigenitalium TaxID=1042321 RepID=A0ABT3BNA2_9BACT|nr:pseudouridine-5'-phosphate glycosidase [Ureaplasma miroungigenitalium]MCV3728632.1 pseudouridine-5'-phosphate glycosidase [Ureaplasma miroungigenitalium]MCV3734323.1 pseudouridine-5'-phosphate glycosidase [Ureaplasma miroungigenitalium]